MRKGMAVGLVALLAVGLAAWVVGGDGWLGGEPDSYTEPEPDEEDEALLEGPELATSRRGKQPTPPSETPERKGRHPTLPGTPSKAHVVPYVGQVFGPGGQPIPDAVVRVTRADGATFTADVDAKGRFRIEAPAGSYLVSIESVFGTITPLARRLDGAPGEHVIQLDDGIALRLKLLTGDEPLANTRVDIRRHDPISKKTLDIANATSDVEGFVVVEALPKGSYTLEIAYGASSSIRFPHKHHVNHTRTIELKPRVKVQGLIVDERGAGVGGADVKLIRRGGWGHLTAFTAAAKTDASGLFSIDAPQAVSVAAPSVEVIADGYELWNSHGWGTFKERQARGKLLWPLALAFVGGAEKVKITLKERTEPVLQGVALDEEGKPVRGLKVTWTQIVAGREVGAFEVTTDDAGRYEIDDLPTGEYTPSVPPGHVLLRPKSIRVGIMRKPFDIRLQVASKTTFTGRVTLPNGAPVQGARVWQTSTHLRSAHPDRPEDSVHTFTDAEGRFAFYGSRKLRRSHFLRASWGELRATPVRATVPTDDVELVLAPAVQLRLQVTARGSERPMQLSVSFQPARDQAFGGTRWTSFTNAEGHLAITVLPERWRVTLRGASMPDKHMEIIDLREMDGVIRHEIEVDAGLTLQGRVVNAEGQPVVASLRLSVGKGGAVKQRLESKPDGTFLISGLVEGKAYWLGGNAQPHGAFYLGPFEAGAQGLELALKPLPR